MIKKSRIPEISNDRLDHTDPDLSSSGDKEEKRAQAFIKGREQTQAFQIRMSYSKWEYLKKICFEKNCSLNKIINDSIDQYLNFIRDEEALKSIREKF